MEMSSRVNVQPSQGSKNLLETEDAVAIAAATRSFATNRGGHTLARGQTFGNGSIVALSRPKYDIAGLNCAFVVMTMILGIVSCAIRANSDNDARWYFLGSAGATFLASAAVWIMALIKKNRRGTNSVISLISVVSMTTTVVINIVDDFANINNN
ncbi:MAG: hypothetical protein CMK92_04565 [Pseudomonas sp.]|nr:hypothetical protein [Pseudomonas sp.]